MSVDWLRCCSSKPVLQPIVNDPAAERHACQFPCMQTRQPTNTTPRLANARRGNRHYWAQPTHSLTHSPSDETTQPSVPGGPTATHALCIARWPRPPYFSQTDRTIDLRRVQRVQRPLTGFEHWGQWNNAGTTAPRALPPTLPPARRKTPIYNPLNGWTNTI